jgi:hypothetical protein
MKKIKGPSGFWINCIQGCSVLRDVLYSRYPVFNDILIEGCSLLRDVLYLGIFCIQGCSAFKDAL